MNRLGLTLVALGILIGGCTQPTTPNNCPVGTTVTQGGCKPNGGSTGSSSPGADTSPEASLPPGTGLYSDSGIDVLGGSLTVSAANTPAGAQYRLYGTTMAITSTNSSGSATLGPLAAGTGYRLIASAPGFATVQIDGIEIVKKQETKRSVQFTPEGTVSGTVTSNGQPVASAVVSDGLNTTLTDVQGKYTLRGCTQGQLTLTASKSRFGTASKAIAVTSGVTEDFALSAVQPVVYFDTSVASGVPLAKLSGLQKALQDKGWQLGTQAPTAGGGVWVLVCPSDNLPDALVTRLVTYVAQGGKLAMFGEWGGFGGFRNLSVDNLAHAIGLHFNPDLVRDPSNGDSAHQQWLPITSVQLTPGLQGVNSLKLYEACSLFGIAPMMTVAQTSVTGYRVQDNAVAGQQKMVMAGPFKGGKAIAFGDTSAFSDEDTDGNGVPNIKEANNVDLVTQLFDW